MPGGLDDLAGVLLEDRALGARRVVLGRLGDALEELRAALVVEVAGRELLERLRQADANVGRHPRERAARRQVDLDLDLAGCDLRRRHYRSLTQRMPREDLSADRQVPVPEGGADHAAARRPGAAAQHLVLRPEEHLRVLVVREGLEARVAREVRARPLPDVAQHLDGAAVRGGIAVGAGGRGTEREVVEVRAVGGRRRCAAASHSSSVGSRFPAQRGEGLGRRIVDVDHGVRGIEGPGLAHRRPHPAAGAVALPVERRLGARLLDEPGVIGVGHGRAVDLERRERHGVSRTLVVVGEAGFAGADLDLAAFDADHLGPVGDRLRGRRRVALDRLVALDHLQ